MFPIGTAEDKTTCCNMEKKKEKKKNMQNLNLFLVNKNVDI